MIVFHELTANLLIYLCAFFFYLFAINTKKKKNNEKNGYFKNLPVWSLAGFIFHLYRYEHAETIERAN